MKETTGENHFASLGGLRSLAVTAHKRRSSATARVSAGGMWTDSRVAISGFGSDFQGEDLVQSVVDGYNARNPSKPSCGMRAVELIDKYSSKTSVWTWRVNGPCWSILHVLLSQPTLLESPKTCGKYIILLAWHVRFFEGDVSLRLKPYVPEAVCQVHHFCLWADGCRQAGSLRPFCVEMNTLPM